MPRASSTATSCVFESSSVSTEPTPSSCWQLLDLDPETDPLIASSRSIDLLVDERRGRAGSRAGPAALTELLARYLAAAQDAEEAAELVERERHEAVNGASPPDENELAEVPTPEENNAISRVVARDDADGAAAAADDDDDAADDAAAAADDHAPAPAPTADGDVEMGEAAPTVRRSTRACAPVRFGGFVYQGE